MNSSVTAAPAALCPPPVPQESIRASKEFPPQFRTFFSADRHSDKNGCGNREETENDIWVSDFPEHDYKRKYICKNRTMKMRRDLYYTGKENKTKYQYEKRMQYRIQAQETSKSNCNAFSAQKSEKYR